MRTKREANSSWAVDSIQALLQRKDFTSAVILAYVYSHIRLRSLVTDSLTGETRGSKWEGTHEFLSVLYFMPMLKSAKKFQIVNPDQFNMLVALIEQRNDIAHRTSFWRNPTPQAKRRIRAVCHFGMQFLLETAQPPEDPTASSD
jgi:hypothetical protein